MVQINCVVLNLVLTFLVFYSSTNGFNLSPKPNLSLREPNLQFVMNKTQSSYFGFTINLRKSSVIIGAPRTQSTLESQQNFSETGAIYRCTIQNDPTCEPLIFDDTGTTNETKAKNLLFHYKDHQWLGASMDGGSEEKDPLVVCAPRPSSVYKEEKSMNGICYWTPNTIDNHLKNITRIIPLREFGLQIKLLASTKNFVYAYGEQGLSAHVTANNEDVIIGAPGVNAWKGSVIQYRPKNNNRQIEKTKKIPKLKTVVPNSDLWNENNDTNEYFGYSVSSGYFDSEFPSKIYYVASAPQAHDLSGEVYIFDIIDKGSWKKDTIEKKYIFHGSQFGTYFGYAVLAEDLNGDTWTDLIITAPLYNLNGNVEQGAIYVFINKGKFVFELQEIINSPVEGNGRFGSSISKLGDINQDGFNDIAVGAPFAGNGAVFIYLGSSEGLRKNHSQQLNAEPIENVWGQQMFGHGLSKGSDIDNNGFNDFAIGAPNAETVFVYRAYPVVKINATIKSKSRAIKVEQTFLQIEICISIQSKTIQPQDIAIQVNVDSKVKRVKFQENNPYEMNFNFTNVTYRKCRLLDTNVTFDMAKILTPIELEMKYDLINGIPNSKDFCEKCAAVDPDDPKVVYDQIMFIKGCKDDICNANLKVRSIGLNQTFVIGSSKTINVTYEVTNSGETAYVPQINITSLNKIPFNKIPTSCNQKNDFVLCDLSRGLPLFKNSTENITIVYDVSEIQGPSINLTAFVFSKDNEQNVSDNLVSDIITLREFTEIDVNCKTNTTYIDLSNVFNSTQHIINNYEIKSRGPSNVQELLITFEIPIAHKFYESIQPIPIIDVDNLTVHCDYDKTLLPVNLEYERQNRNKLGDNSEEIFKAKSHKMDFRAAQKKLQELHENVIWGVVPSINRTIVFSCLDPKITTCERIIIKVNNFKPYIPVNITLEYNVNLNEVNKTLLESLESFVIITRMNISKVGDLDGKTINITGKLEYIDVSMVGPRNNIAKTPWTVIILSSVGGFLILAVITFAMYQFGFFKRKTKEDMEQLCAKEIADFKNELKRRLNMCIEANNEEMKQENVF